MPLNLDISLLITLVTFRKALSTESFMVNTPPDYYILSPSFSLEFWKRLYVCSGLVFSHTIGNIYGALKDYVRPCAKLGF